MSRRSSVIDSSFPGNSDPGGDGDDREADAAMSRKPSEPPPWRTDLLILLAAAAAAFGTFLYEAWQRSHPETLV